MKPASRLESTRLEPLNAMFAEPGRITSDVRGMGCR